MDTPAPPSLDFGDSEVAALSLQGGTLRLRFSVARVVVQGEAGYLKSVMLILSDVRVDGTLDGCVGTLAEGRLRVDGRTVSPLPLPFAAAGRIALELRWRNRCSLNVSAAAVQLQQAGTGTLFADHAC